MAVFTTERTARKAYKCSQCGKQIRPGERYQNIVVTPGGEFGYEGWSRFAEHLSYAACDYELAAEPLPDTPDGGLSDWPIPAETSAPRAGEKE